MIILIREETGKIIEEGDPLTDPLTGRTGIYTGWMPAHKRNPDGLIYVRFEGVKWDDSFLPPNMGCKLIHI